MCVWTVESIQSLLSQRCIGWHLQENKVCRRRWLLPGRLRVIAFTIVFHFQFFGGVLPSPRTCSAYDLYLGANSVMEPSLILPRTMTIAGPSDLSVTSFGTFGRSKPFLQSSCVLPVRFLELMRRLHMFSTSSRFNQVQCENERHRSQRAYPKTRTRLLCFASYSSVSSSPLVRASTRRNKQRSLHPSAMEKASEGNRGGCCQCSKSLLQVSPFSNSS